MLRSIPFAAPLFALMFTALPADEPAKKPENIKEKLTGAWQGGPCVGLLVLQANRTFERLGYTPGNNKLSGVWELREKSNPPILVLTTQKSDDPERLPVGKLTTYRLVQVDDGILAIEDVLFPGGSPVKYQRVKN